jgi:5-hydroxyisourate hydrolase
MALAKFFSFALRLRSNPLFWSTGFRELDTLSSVSVHLALQEMFMGLSTHVLDTMHGSPAAGMAVALFTTSVPDGSATLVKRLVLNADGRNPDGMLFATQSLKTGTYRLVFEVAAYFRGRGVELPEPPFLDQVSLDFGVADVRQHYHVPLLVSPWSYSTYRGS